MKKSKIIYTTNLGSDFVLESSSGELNVHLVNGKTLTFENKDEFQEFIKVCDKFIESGKTKIKKYPYYKAHKFLNSGECNLDENIKTKILLYLSVTREDICIKYQNGVYDCFIDDGKSEVNVIGFDFDLLLQHYNVEKYSDISTLTDRLSCLFNSKRLWNYLDMMNQSLVVIYDKKESIAGILIGNKILKIDEHFVSFNVDRFLDKNFNVRVFNWWEKDLFLQFGNYDLFDKTDLVFQYLAYSGEKLVFVTESDGEVVHYCITSESVENIKDMFRVSILNLLDFTKFKDKCLEFMTKDSCLDNPDISYEKKAFLIHTNNINKHNVCLFIDMNDLSIDRVVVGKKVIVSSGDNSITSSINNAING